MTFTRFFRAAGYLAAAVATLFVLSASAWASPGCDAVNAGGLTTAIVPADFHSVNGQFAPGDQLVLTVIDPGNSPVVGTGGLTFTLGAQTINVAGKGGAPLLLSGFTTTLVANGTETMASVGVINGAADAPTFATVTCTAGNGGLQKIMQINKMVAQSSGAAISGAISAAVSEAFDDSCSAFTPLQNGMRFNVNGLSDRDPACFDDNNRSSTTTNRFAPEAFDGNAYAGKRRSPASDALLAFDNKAAAKRKPQEWRVWIDVRGTHLDTSGAVGDLRGDQVNVLAGLTRKFSRYLVAGIFAGYENFNFTSQAVNGRLRGDGGTIGTYVGWRIVNGVRFDAGLAYSGIGYNAAANQNLPAAVSASFNGDRLFGTAGLTGDYVWRAYTFEPSLRVYWLNEHENAFVDSLSTPQPSRTFSTGRASAGNKVIFPATVVNSTLAVAPYVGLYGDYYFSSDDANGVLTQNGLTAVTLRGISGRAIAGFTGKTTSGVQMLLGGEYGGLGSDIRVWTYRARVGVPF